MDADTQKGFDEALEYMLGRFNEAIAARNYRAAYPYASYIERISHVAAIDEERQNRPVIIYHPDQLIDAEITIDLADFKINPEKP